jgi:hypothetical protein
VVGCVGVQTLLNCPSRHTQRLPARPSRWPPSVPAIHRSWTYESFDFGDDLALERIGELRFFPSPVASTGLASQMDSLMSSNLSQVDRKSRYVATSRSTPGSYEIEFHDASSSVRATPRVSRHCEVLAGRSDHGFGLAIRFGVPLAEAELGEIAAPRVAHESIDLAKSDREAVNAELSVILFPYSRGCCHDSGCRCPSPALRPGRRRESILGRT